MAQNQSLYYYSNGQRIPLKVSASRVAVPNNAILSLRNQVKGSSQFVHPLMHGFSLVETSLLPRIAIENLLKHQGSQPVFTSEGADLIPLPEVRVEEESQETLNQLVDWLSSHSKKYHTFRSGNRLTIKPSNESGVDAVKLAAKLSEQFHPQYAQPRFMRIIPRPLK